MGTVRRAAVIAAVFGIAAPAVADDEPPAPAPAPAPEPTPEPIDWSTAPSPDQASGIAREPATPGRDHALWVPRAILFVPRWAFWAAAQPVRLGAWAWEELKLEARFKRTLFTVDETAGIYPVGRYDSQFGFQAGVRFVHKSMFGRGEKLRLRADFGGPFRQAYGISLASGDRFGSVLEAKLDARYQRKPGERFYGIGNGDLGGAPPAMPIDPTVDDTAIETRYREELWRAVASLEAHVAGPVSARLSGAIVRRQFAGGDFDDNLGIQEAYATDRLTGFGVPTDTAYLEGEVVYDTRRPTSIYQTKAIDAAGWFVNLYLGGANGLGEDPTDYYRYGGEVQTFIDLYRGSRVLALRVLFEELGGTGAQYRQVALPDLPRLGGVEYLRGYPDGRFRDRAMTLGTAEYIWDLGNFLAGFTFVDVGRVWPTLRDVGLDDLRFGYGGGIQAHSRASYLLRFQIAASADGDLLFEFAFSPVYGRRERVGKFY
jgi:outer membrane protein assembly factor BamA